MSIEVHGEEDSLENILYICACIQHAGGSARLPSVQAGKQMNRHHRRKHEGARYSKKPLCVANGVVGRELSRQMYNSIYCSCLQCP